MRSTKSITTLSAGIVLALFCGNTQAGDFSSQFNDGKATFFASPPCPVKQFPTFESIVPVPNIVDPFQQDLIPMFCQVEVTREGKGVKKAKGTFETELVVIDNNTGEAESFPIGSGKFKTNSLGRDSFDFDLPAELFADGFESGDVSAWSYTRTDFTNKKKGNQANVSCGSGSSSSN